MRYAWCLMAAAMFALPAGSRAGQNAQRQDQKQTQAAAQPATAHQDPLVEAARKAREERKKAPKAAMVFTNDNIPKAGGVSSVGTAPPAANHSGAKAAATSASSAKGEKAWREKFARLHKKLEQDQAELSIMQRELGVLNLQNYSNPVQAMHQQLTRQDINEKTAAIAQKKKDIQADEQAIADAQQELRQSGGDPGWAR